MELYIVSTLSLINAHRPLTPGMIGLKNLPLNPGCSDCACTAPPMDTAASATICFKMTMVDEV